MFDVLSSPLPTFVGIPSPDLVLGAFASLAQLLGLLTVGMLGMARSRSGRSRPGRGTSNPWPLRLCAGGLAVVSVAFLFYAAHVSDAETGRLRAALTRRPVENGDRVGRTLTDQREHPLRIEADELAAHLADVPATLEVIDVREYEEYERGGIPAAHHARYPDLMADPGRVRDVPTVLVCFSGNRSSELCEELAALGKDVRFLVGGYKQWIQGGHPLDVPPGVERRELRDIADYPNKDVLLTTAEAAELIEEDDAYVIDVRFAQDAAATPFPGAHVLTMRQMTSRELEQACAAVPLGRPIVTLGYDRRSSFYASLLGLRLHRRGLDFAGRYTVPHEYMPPQPEGAATAHTTTLFAQLAEPLTNLLVAIDARVGSLGLAILLLVALLRLVVFPCSLQIERNSAVQRKLAPMIAELRKRTADAPRVRARETQRLHAEHGLRPVLGLLATVVQVGLFLACFIAVRNGVLGRTDTFLGLTLAEPSSSLALPLLVGLSVAALVMLGGRVTGLRIAGAVAAGIGFTALVAGLESGVNLYLVTNLGLVVAQTLAIRAFVQRRNRRKLRLGKSVRRIVPLADADVAPGVGKKAERLGELMSIGVPVPDGFVLTEALLFADDGPPSLTAQDNATIDRLWAASGAERVAVRSSGLNEDGAEQSYAGVFESVLDVDRDGLDEAMHEVWSSMSSLRAKTYGDASRDERGAAVVQRMVAAEFSGVLFTEHPEHPASMLVEMAEGLGEQIVGGQVTPTTHRYGRVTSALLDGDVAPIDVGPLLEIARKIEKHFGRAQDIEWCFADGRFWIVQARDVTALLRHNDEPRGWIAAEQHRLLELTDGLGGRELAFEQNELTELLPAPSPMSLGLMEALWADDGAVERASAELGVPYDVDDRSAPYVLTAFGSLYVNVPEGRRRFGRGMGGVANFRLTRRIDAIGDEFEQEVLPRFLQRVRLDEVAELSRLDFDELVSLFDAWSTRFMQETYVEAERINIAAEYTLRMAERELVRRGLDPAQHLAHAPETVVHEAMELLRTNDDVDQSVAMFLDVFKHRAPLDFEISQPRYGEDEALVRALAESSVRRDDDEATPPSEPPTTGEQLVDLALGRARRFQALKEEAKHHCLRDFALLRRVLLVIAERLELGDSIFLLRPDEVARLRQPSFRDSVLRRTASRRDVLDALRQVQLPTKVTVEDLEQLGTSREKRRRKSGDGIVGTRISGRPNTRGYARVLYAASEMDSFRDGEILVGRFTDPTWAPLFPRARGIVTEVGGWLSHAAIQAREYDIAGIVGASGALDGLETGDLVELRADGSVEVLQDGRRWERQPCDEQPITIRWEGRREDALLVDVSCGGARVRVEGDVPEITEVEILSAGTSWRGSVVARGTDGSLGIHFARELTPSETELLLQPDSFHR